MEKKQEAKNLFNLGVEEYKKENFELSTEYFEKALSLLPDNIGLLENLALSLYNQKKFFEAIKILKKAIDQESENQKAFDLLQKIYKELNEKKKLEQIIIERKEKKKLTLKDEISSKIFFPNFFNSKEEIKLCRDDLDKNLNDILNNKNIKLDVSKEYILPPIFQLSYDEYDNLKINEKIVCAYRHIYPKLNDDIKLIENNTSKIRIGFISEYFTDHTISKLYRGIIENLDRNKFEIIIFHSYRTRKGNYFKKILEMEVNGNVKNIFLTKNFDEKIQTIINNKLDIVFYPDIHMSFDLYFLSYLRLAKFQINSWGHPETTGNKSLDYFLSSKLCEIKTAQNHYTEKLILTDYLPMYFYKPKIDENIKLEENILSQRNVYCCPQTLIKFHPNFDEIFKKILIKDKKAKIFLLKDPKNILSNSILNRIKKKLGSNIDRFVFLDRINTQKYINHCGQASVLLDPIYFGAGNSFHESMYYGTPTVTMPSNYLKSRIVKAAYEQMKIENSPVTNTVDEYVDLSIEIANMDKKKALDQKKYLSQQASKHLFENKKFISELENILIKITSFKN
tara:strand:- start:1743 stop:3440 length:1698 start_codon:yes stop_codon:yes gene_type:complete